MPDSNPLGQTLKNSAESMADMARTAAQTVDDARQTAAQRLSTTVDYVRTHDAKRVLADVERVVKNNPGLSLVIAAAFGFVIGRALTRD